MTALAKPPLLGTVVDPQFGTTSAASRRCPRRRQPRDQAAVLDRSRPGTPTRAACSSRGRGGEPPTLRRPDLRAPAVLDIAPPTSSRSTGTPPTPTSSSTSTSRTLVRYHVSTGVKETVRHLRVLHHGSERRQRPDVHLVGLAPHRAGLRHRGLHLRHLHDTRLGPQDARPRTRPRWLRAARSPSSATAAGSRTPRSTTCARSTCGSPGARLARPARERPRHLERRRLRRRARTATTTSASLVTWDLTDATSRVIVGPKTGWPYPSDGHISALAYERRAGWSCRPMGGTSGAGLLDMEMLLADTNTGNVCRAGRTPHLGQGEHTSR